MNVDSLRNPTPPPIQARDAAALAALAVLLPVAWLVPRRAWRGVGLSTARLASALSGGATLRNIHRATAGVPSIEPARRIHERLLAGRIEQELHYLREARPGRFDLPVSVDGFERIGQALARGRGCILWVGPFVFASLLVKKALHRRGMGLVHLSRDLHGPSDSRFGRWCINPVRTWPEASYVAERVTMTPGGGLRALRVLERRLRSNAVVSIACARYGHRTVRVPVLRGRLDVATGAPGLAVSTGAALLPVATVRDDEGAFRVVIDEPLEPSAAPAGRGRVDDLLERYAAWMERWIVREPGSFSAWRYLSFDDPGEEP